LLGVPVFVKIMGIALGMAGLLAAGLLWQIHLTWHEHLRRDAVSRGHALAQSVAGRCAEVAAMGRASELGEELRESLQESTDVAYLVLQEERGAVLAEARAPGDPPPQSSLREITAPVADGARQVRVGLSLARVDHEVHWLTWRLAATTAGMVLLGLLLAWGLTRILVQPIQELVTLSRAVKEGDYHARAPVRASDEVGELAVAFNEMTQAIAQKESARQQLLGKVIRAGEEERKRIARELHDQTGQALTSQIASLSALENVCRDPAARQRLTELRRQVEQTLSEVHDLSVTLRPSVLDDVGLVAALQRHCRTFAQRVGVNVDCAEIGMNGWRLPAEVELTLYRVAQEALTNAVRHGRASRIHVLLQRTATGVLATVQDNGCGFDARDWQRRCLAGNHLGLLGIEERVTLLGGSFCVESEPARGVTVYADIPLPEVR
jgi:signal transduction histidine kinase